jgi:hypothetical protein
MGGYVCNLSLLLSWRKISIELIDVEMASVDIDFRVARHLPESSIGSSFGG